MIRRSSILRDVADAIESSTDFREAVDGFGGQYRMLLGMPANEDLQTDSRVVTVAVAFGEEPYDAGYVQTRTADVLVRVMVYDKTVDKVGGREEYLSILTCHDLCQYVAESARGISVLGDHVLGAAVTVSAESWPLAVGEINISVDWPVTLGADGLEETS